jgi:hypothetical protein
MLLISRDSEHLQVGKYDECNSAVSEIIFRRLLDVYV